MAKKRAAYGHITIPQFLTVNEVLDKLSISRSTFDKLARNGEFGVIIKMDRGVRVELAEVQRWIEAHRSEQ